MSLATCASCLSQFNSNIGATCPFCGVLHPAETPSRRGDKEWMKLENRSGTDSWPGEGSSLNEAEIDDSAVSERGFINDTKIVDPADGRHASFDDAVSQEHLPEQQEAQLPESRSIVSLLFSPFGRIGRRGLFLGFGLVFCVLAISELLDTVMSVTREQEFSPAWAALILAAFIASWMISLKRSHDVNHSGGVLFMVSLCLGLIPMLYFAFASGSRGRNTYGPRTKIEWNFFSCLITVMLVFGGVYSMLIMSQLSAVETSCAKAFAAYSDGRNEEAEHSMQATFRDAEFSGSLCPICSDFRKNQMYSAWVSGDIFATRGEWASAAEWLKKAVDIGETVPVSFRFPDLQSNLYDVRLQLVNALEKSGKPQEATALLEEMNAHQAAAPEGNRRDLVLKSSEALLRMGREEYDEALKLYTPLIEQTRSELEGDQANHDLRSALGGYFHNRSMARSHLGDVNGALADLQQAIQFQELALEAQPDNPVFSEFAGKHQSFIGSLYYRNGEVDRALAAFKKASQHAPQDIEYRLETGRILLERYEYARIVELLGPFVAESRDVNLEYLLALSQFRQKLNDEASEVVDRMRSRFPNEVPSLFLTGVIAMNEGDYSRASDVLMQALPAGQSQPAILYNIAICQMNSGHSDEAEVFILRLQDIDPGLSATLRQGMQTQASERPPLPAMLDLYGL